MPDKELVNVIKWRDDPASQKVLERLEKLQDRAARLQQRLDSLQTVTRALKRGWNDLDGSGDKANRSLKEQAARAQDVEREMKQLKTAIKETDKALDDLADPRNVNVTTNKDALEQARRYGDVESRTRAITGAIGYYGGGDIEKVANLGAELLAVNEAAGLLREEFPKLVKGMGLTRANATLLAGEITVAAAVLVALKVAFDQVSKSAEKNREAVQRYLAEEDAVAEAHNKTADEIRAELAERKAYLDALKAERDSIKNTREQMDATPISETLTDLAEMAEWLPLGWSAGIEDIKSHLDSLNEKITDEEGAINGLNKALDSSAVSANTLKAAEEELAAKRDAIAGQLIGQAQAKAQREIERQYELMTITTEQAQQQQRMYAAQLVGLKAAEQELDRLANEGRISPDEYVEQWNALSAQIKVAQSELGFYVIAATEAGQANDRAAAALERVNVLTKARHENLKEEAAAQEKANQELARAAELTANYTDQVAQTSAKRKLQEQRDEEDFQRQRARDIANHYAEIADIDAKYYESVADTLAGLVDDVAAIDKEKVKELAEQNKDMQRLAKDHNKAMLQIARDLDNSQQDAVEERDVSAAIRNARQAQEDARNQNEQYEEERDRREEDFEDRLKELDEQRAEKQERGRQALLDLKTQHQKERQQNIAAFNAELSLQDQERRIKLQRQQEDYRIEDQLRRQNFTNQISQYSQHYTNVLTTTQTGLGKVQSAVQAAWNAIAGSITSSGLTVSGGGSARYVSGDGRAKAYGTGGKALPGQWIITGDTGTEMAKFNRDGSWDILNPRKTQQALSQSISLSVPVQIYDASSPAMIESVFEQRVIPKLISAVRQAAPQGVG